MTESQNDSTFSPDDTFEESSTDVAVNDEGEPASGGVDGGKFEDDDDDEALEPEDEEEGDWEGDDDYENTEDEGDELLAGDDEGTSGAESGEAVP